MTGKDTCSMSRSTISISSQVMPSSFMTEDCPRRGPPPWGVVWVRVTPLWRVTPMCADSGCTEAVTRRSGWLPPISRLSLVAGTELNREAIAQRLHQAGAIEDPLACEQQFRSAFLMGCVGTWTLHPSQIEIAKREFSPTAGEVDTAKRIMEAMGDGTGTVMLDGRMQDDATFKQASVIVQTAKLIAERDPEYAELYGL